ncbi:hypothetical protein VCRA2123O444_140084 [Vibrio crassostreae]|nr:hypothetical protein VCRA2113O411_100062 [Vibrio crassostreae]CAK1697990.1 hypothetical protein VCRA2113O412_100062 [Vibrio crassostreae]CAK1698211.1 hypothetical protein VCRA2118O429_100062 [Vibrio crassostreae]CAK1698238.1 hypothetical protein VCRA2114O421_100062 [Vibrio crassostreae]CAK1704218.1 hypothetical protein VCRA2113O414_100121 [Vibrio crassostreae]
MEEMPFPIQRIQTERGREFFADKVQKQLMTYGAYFGAFRSVISPLCQHSCRLRI